MTSFLWLSTTFGPPVIRHLYMTSHFVGLIYKGRLKVYLRKPCTIVHESKVTIHGKTTLVLQEIMARAMQNFEEGSRNRPLSFQRNPLKFKILCTYYLTLGLLLISLYSSKNCFLFK